MITIPAEFASYTAQRAGAAGRRWIEDLPRLVADLCEGWNLRVDGEPMHGGLAIVVPVLRGKDPQALKVCWLDESTIHEADALTLWNGRGAVRLLDANPQAGALLLERLDGHRTLNSLPLTQAIGIAGRLLRRLAVLAPPRFRPVSAVAADLSESLPGRWERFGRPMPRTTVDRACELAAELARSRTRLAVNYDLHYGNILAGTREPWLAIDPKVVAGEPEFGMAQLLWTHLDEMTDSATLEYHFDALVDAAELDNQRARSWTLVAALTTGSGVSASA